MRILLADDNEQIRSALRLLLEEAERTMDVNHAAGSASPAAVEVFEAVDGVSLLDRLAECAADIVLLDWELPGTKQPRTLEAMRALRPECRVIAMSGRPEARREAEQWGADGFVGRSDPPEVLLALLRNERGAP